MKKRTSAMPLCLALAACAAVSVQVRCGVPTERASQPSARPRPAAKPIPPPSRSLPLNQWVNDGPYGAEIEAIRVHPLDNNTVVATSKDCFFRSVDGGATWTRTLVKPWWKATALAYSNDGKQLFAGGNGSLYRSADGGATWSEVPDVGGAEAVIGVGPQLIGRFTGDIYASSDGEKWERRTAPADGHIEFAALATHLYAAVESAVFVSDDAARTWRKLAFPNKRTIDIAAAAPSTLYVANENGLMRSSDSGQTWTDIENFIGTKLYDVWTSGSNAVVVQSDSGLHRSTDGGKTWGDLPRPDGRAISKFTVAESSPQVMIASTYDAQVFRSTDGGEHWINAVNGLLGAPVDGLAIGEAGRIFAATDTTLSAASRTEGWTTLVRAQPLDSRDAFTGVYAARGNVYAGRGQFAHRLERSTDGGKTWSAWGDPYMIGVFEHPAQPSRLVVSSTTSLFYTDDNGTTFHPIAQEDAKTVVILKSGRWYGIRGDSLCTSGDDGRTWADVNVRYPKDLAAAADGRLWVVAQTGVAIVRDKLLQRPVQTIDGIENGEYTSVAAHPTNPAIVLVGTSGSGIFMTRDSGKTWSKLRPDGGPLDITKIVFDRQDPSYLYVATGGESVYSLHTSW